MNTQTNTHPTIKNLTPEFTIIDMLRAGDPELPDRDKSDLLAEYEAEEVRS